MKLEPRKTSNPYSSTNQAGQAKPRVQPKPKQPAAGGNNNKKGGRRGREDDSTDEDEQPRKKQGKYWSLTWLLLQLEHFMVYVSKV